MGSCGLLDVACTTRFCVPVAEISRFGGAAIGTLGGDPMVVTSALALLSPRPHSHLSRCCTFASGFSNSLDMRIFYRLLAVPSAVGTQSAGLKQVPPALLPPIPLYRRLLRAHRKHLPGEMRVLGDRYIQSEFRAHRNTENPVHIVGFLSEWQTYCQQIEGEAWRGETMDKTKIDKMSGK